MAFGLDDIIAEGMKILDKYLPDPQAKMNAQIEMMKITQADNFKEIDANLQAQQMQADTNKVEAASESFFKSGWRPSVGWVCSASLGLQFLIFPLASFVLGIFKISVVFPTLDMGTLLTLLFSLLGLGGYRTWEKINTANGSK